MLNIQTIKSLIEKEGHVFESSSQEQGCFGCVIFTYLKDHENMKFAIKVFDVDDGSKQNVSQEKVKECQKEAKAMTTFFHKNVVQYHSEKLLGLFYFILMQRCESSLYVWSQNNQNMIQNNVFYNIALQILDGLEFIHSKDWVLRDLKPQNILINYQNGQLEVKLCDFGAARHYPKLIKPKSTHFYGSLNYSPPEVIKQLKLQKENVLQTKIGDIWAYGICLSEIGKSKLNFDNYDKPNWVVPISPLLSEKAQKFVNFLLVPNPSNRPEIKEIREKLFQLFKDDIAQMCKLQIDQKLKPNQILPLSDHQNPLNPAPQLPMDIQNDFASYINNQIVNPAQELCDYIYLNLKCGFEINDENFPGGKSDYLWLVFVASILFHLILTLLYAILTAAQNVLLVVLLSVNFFIPQLIYNHAFLKSKKVYVIWILLQSLIITFLNLALQSYDPTLFNVFFAAYQIFILIKLLYFLNIPYNNADQLFCYLILIYPIFLQLQYSSQYMLLVLIFEFVIHLFSVLLHLWGANKKIHLQGIYVVKQILNLVQNILVCIFYSLGLSRNEDFCAAFLLNIINIFLSSLLQLRVQNENKITSYYYIIPRIVFQFNSMLCYVIQNTSYSGIIAISVIKVVLSFIIILSYIFFFRENEHKKRNKIRYIFDSLCSTSFLILDCIGLAISCQTGCSQGVAIFATLLSIDAILALFSVVFLLDPIENGKDIDSIYI